MEWVRTSSIKNRAAEAEATVDEMFGRMSNLEVREMNKALDEDPGIGAGRYQTMREHRLAEEILAERLKFPRNRTTTAT